MERQNLSLPMEIEKTMEKPLLLALQLIQKKMLTKSQLFHIPLGLLARIRRINQLKLKPKRILSIYPLKKRIL